MCIPEVPCFFAPDGDSVYGVGENFREDMLAACMNWLRGYIIQILLVELCTCGKQSPNASVGRGETG